jgi:putative drug exporter of the RND superfamily
VVSPYGDNGVRQIDPTGTIAYATVNLAQELTQTDTAEIGKEIDRLIPDRAGLQVEVGGEALAEFEPPEAELIGLSFAIVILIVAFGSVLAMGLPDRRRAVRRRSRGESGGARQQRHHRP